jgi:CRP-like cAMP-binding protein
VGDLVGDHPVFRDLPPEDAALVARCGANAGFRAGTLVLQEGQAADAFYLIRVGRVSLEAHSPVGAVAVDAACLRTTCDRDPRLGYELMKRFALVMEARLHRARLKGLDLYAHDAVG